MHKKVILIFIFICTGIVFGQDSWNIDLCNTFYSGECKIAQNIDNICYCNHGKRFSAVDYSNLNNPVELGYINLEDEPEKLVVKDNYAFISTKYSKLIIIDLSDPENLNIVNTYIPDEKIVDFDIGNNLAILVSTYYINIFDISDLYSIKQLNKVRFPSVYKVLIQNDLLFAQTSNKIYMYKIMMDCSLEMLDFKPTKSFSNQYNVVSTDKNLFVSTGTNLKIFDFSSRDSLAQVNSFDIKAYQIAIHDNFAFIQTEGHYAYEDYSIEIEHGSNMEPPEKYSIIKKIDIFNVDNVSVVDSFFVPWYCYDFCAGKDILYASSTSEGLCAFDLTENSTQYSTNSFSLPKDIDHLFVIENYLYLIENETMRVLNISNIDSISFIYSTPIYSSIDDYQIIDNKLFLLGVKYSQCRLKCFDISDPSTPYSILNKKLTIAEKLKLVQRELDKNKECISNFGNRFYVQNNDNSSGIFNILSQDRDKFIDLKVVNIDDSFYMLKPPSSFDFPKLPMDKPVDFTVSDYMLYSINRSKSSEKFSYLATFSSLTQIMDYCKFTSAEPIAIKKNDNYLYITSSDSSLSIFDISTPEHPILRGKIVLSDIVTGIDFKDDFVFLACNRAGLIVLDISRVNTISVCGAFKAPYNITNIALHGHYAFLTCKDHGFCIADISTSLRGFSKKELGNKPENISFNIKNILPHKSIKIKLPKGANTIEIFDNNGKIYHKAYIENSSKYKWQPSVDLGIRFYNVRINVNENQTHKMRLDIEKH